jgi:hypothetical protein
MPDVSVVMQAPEDGRVPDGLLRPLLSDRETLEVLVVGGAAARRTDARVVASPGGRGEAVAAARGEIVLLLDAGVVATRALVSEHARRHAGESRRLVVGYTPIRVIHERVPGDSAVRLRADHYRERCELYERDPASVLVRLWGGNMSMRRGDWQSLGLADAADLSGRQLGARCAAAGIEGVFDRSLTALRIYEPSIAAFVREARAEGTGGRPHRLARWGASASLFLRAVLFVAGTAHAWVVQDRATRVLWELESAT